MAAVMQEREQAIFENTGQAVHVAFLIMAQPATQGMPFRLALIRILESIKLADGNQRNWLDQLRGAAGDGTVNFSGLSSDDIRAQCAMITQAVKSNLPEIEMWVLQAKYGHTDYEDIAPVDGEDGPLEQALAEAATRAEAAQLAVHEARRVFALACSSSSSMPITNERRASYKCARDGLSDANHELAEAESAVRLAEIEISRSLAPKSIDNGRAPQGAQQLRRRWAFSAERIAAIQGLSEWFRPMFPRLKPLAIDCMLGRMFANHKKVDISARDLAARFDGSYTTYIRASWKMKNHIRQIEEQALARLAPVFIAHGVVDCRN